MRRYKGYYIDGAIFKTEKQIDDFIKDEIIRKIKIFHSMLFEMGDRYTNAEKLGISDEIHQREIRLHDEYGMEWADIEEIPYRA